MWHGLGKPILPTTITKEERVFIQIVEHDDGSRTYAVGGGTKNNGQMESFNTPKQCLEEIRMRVAQTLLEM